MKKRPLLCLLPVLGLLLGAAGWLWQWPLHAPTEALAYRLILSEPVYRHAHDAALRDVTVLDDNGHQVPTALYAIADAQRPRHDLPLPWFVLPGATGGDAQRLDIISQRDAGGRVLRIESREATAVASTPSSYLVDASQLPHTPQALHLELAAGAEVDARVQVEGSDDLGHWQVLQGPSVILQVSRDGRQLRQNRIPLPRSARYLRLSVTGKTSLPLQSVRAELVGQVRETPRQWREFKGQPGKRTHSVEFEVDGRQPFDRAGVLLPGNAAVRVRLESRDDPDAPWQTRTGEWMQYRLADMQSANVQSFAPVRHRYWRLLADEPLDALVQLKLGWKSEQLIFIATGKPPYRLVAGSARNHRQAAAVDELLIELREQQGQGWQPEMATIEGEGTLADPDALAVPRNYKHFVLWGLLIAAALLVAGFAISLLRQGAKPAD